VSNTAGWNRLADWVDLHGARLSGSVQLERALDYALSAMRADGFDNVHEEIVNVTRWVRGAETLKMVSPYNKTLNFLSIGSSVGTGAAAIVAPILVVTSFDDLTARASEAKGKIVVFDYYCDWAALGGLACYEKSAGYRSVGANAAAAVGAVAVLVRSLTEYSLGTPHTVLLPVSTACIWKHEPPSVATTPFFAFMMNTCTVHATCLVICTVCDVRCIISIVCDEETAGNGACSHAHPCRVHHNRSPPPTP